MASSPVLVVSARSAGVKGGICTPQSARYRNMVALKAPILAVKTLSLWTILFHCLASSGAGASRRAGVAE